MTGALNTQPDLLDGQFYVEDPYSTYAWMRENEPIYWDEVNNLWAVFRYDDIVAIEKDKATFKNGGQADNGYRPGISSDPSIIGLDDPEHQVRRQLVARRFTPRAVSGFEEHVREVVTEILDRALAAGTVDAVGDMADPRASDVDHAPAKVSQPGVNSQNAHACPVLSCFARISTKREHPPS